MPVTLEQYYAELKKKFYTSVEQQAFADSIKALNDYTASMRKPDKYGRIPYVTAAQQKRVMELHTDIAKFGGELLAHEGSDALKDIVKKISALANQNLAVVAGYDPAREKKTLDTLEEEARTLTLDLRGSELPKEKVGNALSTRQIISYLDEKGKTVTGLFTAKKEIGVWYPLSNALNVIKEEALSDEGKDLVESFLTKVRDLNDLDMRSYKSRESAALGFIFRNSIAQDDQGGYFINAEKLAHVIGVVNGISKEEAANAIGADALIKMADAMTPHINDVLITMRDAEIEDGSRIDSRNSAMSAVASLLGVPKVIAPSRPMKLITPDGTVIEGTFMLEGKGLDPQNLESQAQGINGDALVNTNGKGFKDLADLQVLDFICGNVDRHYANMLYQFDKDKKLIGVQGIDNDCSFGEYVPKGGESHMRLTGLDHLGCVSKSMYDRIMSLDGDTLKYALRGYGLTDKQLDAAARRLDVLQKKLENDVTYYEQADKNDNNWPEEDYDVGVGDEAGNVTPYYFHEGHVRVVPDDQFHRVRMDDVKVRVDDDGLRLSGGGGDEGNTFECARNAVRQMGRDYENQTRPYRVLGANTKIHGAVNRCRAEHLNEVAESSAQLRELFWHNTKRYHSSGNYRDMQHAARELATFQRSLYTRITMASNEDLVNRPDYKMDVQAVVGPDDLKKMKEYSEKLERMTIKYLKGKGILPEKEGQAPKHSLEDYSPYTQGRIQAARQALEYARKSKEFRPEELDMAKVNHRQAKENLARRLGDKQEAKRMPKAKQPQQEGLIKN